MKREVIARVYETKGKATVIGCLVICCDMFFLVGCEAAQFLLCRMCEGERCYIRMCLNCRIVKILRCEEVV